MGTKSRKYLQYTIVVVNLDPTIGNEIKKTRPCVIISPDEMNRHLQTITIAPITSQSKPYPSRVSITLQASSQTSSQALNSWIVLDQIRTIDRIRITKTLGKLADSDIALVKATIKEIFVD
jgi:mRNA interferase MazF